MLKGFLAHILNMGNHGVTAILIKHIQTTKIDKTLFLVKVSKQKSRRVQETDEYYLQFIHEYESR